VAPLTALVVDDDEGARALVATALRADGFAVTEAVDGAGARREVVASRPDVVVLELELPDESGLELLSQVLLPAGIPAVLLSGRAGAAERVVGLELGAEDYVVKPFFPRELSARVRRAARRRAVTSSLLVAGDVMVDVATRDATVAGRHLDLTAREFDLLAHLAAAPRRAFSRDELLRQVWRSSPEWQSPRTVTEHVRRLRAKVEDDPARPSRIVTVGGGRYRLE
jgi:two-component system, OmpR family, phosphate regulon response regulator PhoB